MRGMRDTDSYKTREIPLKYSNLHFYTAIYRLGRAFVACFSPPSTGVQGRQRGGLRCPKSTPNFPDITWNAVENLILHEIFRVASRSPPIFHVWDSVEYSYLHDEILKLSFKYRYYSGYGDAHKNCQSRDRIQYIPTSDGLKEYFFTSSPLHFLEKRRIGSSRLKSPSTETLPVVWFLAVFRIRNRNRIRIRGSSGSGSRGLTKKFKMLNYHNII